MSAPKGYSRIQIALHWLIAALIIAVYATGGGTGRALRQVSQGQVGIIDGATLHIWLGAAVFVAILARIIVRLARGAPKPVAHGGVWAERAAEWGHRLIYALMIAVPGSGVAAWVFGLDTGDLHEVLANVLMIVALGHAVIAIAHQVVFKDGTLTRMLWPA